MDMIFRAAKNPFDVVKISKQVRQDTRASPSTEAAIADLESNQDSEERGPAAAEKVAACHLESV